LTTFWKLFKNIGKYKGLVAGNMLCNFLVAVFTIVSIPAIIPFFEILFDQVELVTDRVAPALTIESIVSWAKFQYSRLIIEFDKQTALLYICGFIVIIFFFKNLFRYLSLAFLVPVRNGIVRDLRMSLYDKVLSLPMAFYSNERKGDLIARFSTDVQEIEHSILNVVEVLVKSPMIIFGSIAFMFYVSPALTVFVFILILFTIVIIGGISRTLKKRSLEAQSKLGSIISTAEETISGLKIIKGFGAERFFAKHFEEQNTSFKNLLNRILWRRDVSSPLSEFLGIAVVAVLLWYGSNRVFAGELEPGTFFAFIFAFFNVIEPAKSFSKAYYDVQKGLAAAERVDQVLQEPNTILEDPHPLPLEQLDHDISFCDVSFSYGGADQIVLKNIDLKITVGRVIALVGASGSGKTTIIDLLNRFYDVSSGSIEIDGVDLRRFVVADVRKFTSIVSQDPIVFNDTIYNNITLGREDATVEEVMAAANIAYAHDFIEGTENGYQTIVGDRGVKLSGGQLQRITLARAILKDASVLILDEATSALDSESERAVQSALKEIVKGKTVIIIAHRLSTIQHADQIFVIKDGSIIETGKHEELMEQGGEYKKFVELQAF